MKMQNYQCKSFLIILFSLMTIINSFGQNPYRSIDSTRFKYPIVINYETGQLDFPRTKKYMPKDVKVGSVMQISILNLPKGYSVSSKTTFENDKMEGASLFNGIIIKGLNPNNSNVNKTAEEEAKKKNYDDSLALSFIINEEFNKTDTATNTNTIKLIKKLENKDLKVDTLIKYRTNIDSLKYALAIWNARNFLQELTSRKNKDTSGLAKALEDVNHQVVLFGYAQNNIKDRVKRKDNLISKYAKMVDSLANLIPLKENKNLLGVQILNRDYTNVELEIRDNNNNIVNFVPLTFANAKGFKLDFSTGVFNTFNKISDYEIISDTIIKNNRIMPRDSFYRIQELPKGNKNISIGILAHGYKRNSEFLSFGASFGFSYALETKSLNILSGISLLLGREQRFILNVGYAFANVNKLTLYKTDVSYSESYLKPGTDLKLSKEMKSAVYLGITYNLGAIKTKVIKK